MTRTARLATALLISDLPDIETLSPGRGSAILTAVTLRELLTGHPVVRWLAPDIAAGNQFEGDLADVVEVVLAHGGTVDMFDDRSGVAVWANATGARQPIPHLATLRRRTVDTDYADRCTELHKALTSAVPQDRGHLLVCLTSRPDAISAVRVWALLHHHHRLLDTNPHGPLSAHAVAFDPATRWLLRRHGYIDSDSALQVPAGLKGSEGSDRARGPGSRLQNGTAWWPMHREPRPALPNGGGTS